MQAMGDGKDCLFQRRIAPDDQQAPEQFSSDAPSLARFQAHPGSQGLCLSGGGDISQAASV